jgi:hypothetical protein
MHRQPLFTSAHAHTHLVPAPSPRPRAGVSRGRGSTGNQARRSPAGAWCCRAGAPWRQLLKRGHHHQLRRHHKLRTPARRYGRRTYDVSLALAGLLAISGCVPLHEEEALGHALAASGSHGACPTATGIIGVSCRISPFNLADEKEMEATWSQSESTRSPSGSTSSLRARAERGDQQRSDTTAWPLRLLKRGTTLR